MMTSRIYFYVKCDRCGVLGDAQHDLSGPPRIPLSFAIREVRPEWAFGSTQDSALLCRNCVEAVDAQMAKAWTEAMARRVMPEAGK